MKPYRAKKRVEEPTFPILLAGGIAGAIVIIAMAWIFGVLQKML